MSKFDQLFDGSNPDLIETARIAFEADAAQYDFNLTRRQCAAPEPWSEYANEATGHRWGGWLAAMASAHTKIAELEQSTEYAWKNTRLIDAARMKAESELAATRNKP